MKKDEITKLVEQMTLEEKVSLCSGQDFWHTKEIPRLKIPSILMTDGPHGLRKISADRGMEISQHATCFPTAAALGSSWDPELAAEVARAIGLEAKGQGIQLLLGPGVNMKRSPLCGRNFEYYSEDPVLSAGLAAAFVKGVQSRGVGACVKHFAANNQETDRMRIDVVVDQRALHETYLRAFEKVVKQAEPLAVMAAYNKINGEYCCQNRELLFDILHKEWGFNGIVVSDWAAVYDRVLALNAGLHLQMPYDGSISDKKIVKAVHEGVVTETHLDNMVVRLLQAVFWTHNHRSGKVSVDYKAHHKLARRAAAESIVLLKNEQQILPIEPRKYRKILVVGGFAQSPRFQGAGSSQINPTAVDIPYEEIKKAGGSSFTVYYAEGYAPEDKVDNTLIKQACESAQDADIVIVLAGLPDLFESEGYDRVHLDLPAAHNELISELAKVNGKIVVVLQNGSAVTMPWLDQVQAVLEVSLGGQAVGGAIADVLFGKVNPSGKLSETFAHRLSDTPAYVNWPGQEGRVFYGEGIFVGYRYYEKKRIAPLFIFGHGLSYTSFEYSNLKTDESVLSRDDVLEITCTVKNTGQRSGKEVVQLYLGLEKEHPEHPLKQLAAFRKIELQPGQKKSVSFTLAYGDFAFYSVLQSKWVSKAGVYTIYIGSSSRDIRLHQRIELKACGQEKISLTKFSTFKEWLRHPKGKEQIKPIMSNMLRILGIADEDNTDDKQKEFVKNVVADMPICKMTHFSQGKITERMIDDIVKQVE
jgi:beta-glucosidase